ncbi:MAG: class I SAM-dependent methyltransferase [Nocardioidaceae bacterium]|nr:class I SAM-dependent methyltransferase [Nocardioidaceae bacterium]
MSEDEQAAVRARARSFGTVAETYDRARPSYPADAVTWLVGAAPSRVVELGAGTGKLTELLLAAGHQVIATDPSPEMLALLRRRAPGAQAAVGTAEQIPVPSRSADVVVCAESFHWFEHDVALPEIARVLRPGGVLALVWNARDEGIPWVRRLGTVIGNQENNTGLEQPAASSEHFGFVDSHDFRFWQSLRRDELADLVRSRSNVAVMSEDERAAVLERVGSLYDDYGRGPDGMQLPYVTKCFRTVVQHQSQPPVVLSRVAADQPAAGDPEATQAIQRTDVPAPPEDPGTLLIDFR